VSTHPDAEGTPVDLAALDELAVDLGSVEPVRSIVETYLTELGRRRELVLAAAAAGDIDNVHHAAHLLRSTSRTLGAHGVDRVAAELEAAPQPVDGGLLDRFEQVVRITVSALEGWISEGPASRS
jgi:HPt (histidine-containing phosphotransfer) domain-containing protein